MRIVLHLMLIASLTWVFPVQAFDRSVAQNLRLTRQHFTRLLQGPEPQVAELRLLLNQMPKGGDLHHHYSGSIYAETYLDWVGQRGYCIYSESLPPKIRQFQVETRPESLDDARRKICLSAEDTLKNNQLYRGLLQRWSNKDFLNHYHDQPPPDQQFFDTFSYFGAVSDAGYLDGLRLLKQRAKDENLQYLETMLRTAPHVEHPEWAARINQLGPQSSRQEVQDTLAAMADFMARDPTVQAGIQSYVTQLEQLVNELDDSEFMVRFQAYASRNYPPARVFSSLYSAFQAASISRVVVGVNLVGPENGAVAMRDYTLHMMMFGFLRQRFPQVPVALHAGELALGMVPPEAMNNHIRQGIEVAGANRIGHGIALAHEVQSVELLATLKQRQIPIEVNLTSNAFILGISGAAHPVALLRRYGVPFVISTDDSGVSRTNLSEEYLLFATRYRPSYDELKRLVYQSLRFAFVDATTKAAQQRALDRRFVHFEEMVANMARSTQR